MARCPVCDTSIEPNKATTVPFCSDRCRLIDLGRWLDESYGVPGPVAAEDDTDETDEARVADG